MHFSFQSESFLIFEFVFVKKAYAISVHNDNLSFTKTKSALTRKFAKTFVQQKTLNAEKVYDCL